MCFDAVVESPYATTLLVESVFIYRLLKMIS
jgi:hypothetical protein